MKIFIGGLNAVGKSTILKIVAEKLGFKYIHITSGLMDSLDIVGDYQKLNALTQAERDVALNGYVKKLLTEDGDLLLDGHYFTLVKGNVTQITGPWIKDIDRLILVSASTEDIWNRIQKDERDRTLFPDELSEDEMKDMLNKYQEETRKEFKRLGELYQKDGIEVLNSENNLEETVQNLVEYIEKYRKN
jgi:adenylate kinase